ncbi:MAG: hypothetical protein M1837_002474 [Sclerophora amabilis]|nr:MAG: hypothetical protein M1837_002474 [Sclerophora amabilis]
MASNPAARESHERQGLPSPASPSPTIILSPDEPDEPQRRNTFRRHNSDNNVPSPISPGAPGGDDHLKNFAEIIEEGFSSPFGLEFSARNRPKKTYRRLPEGVKSPHTVGSGDHLLSPPIDRPNVSLSNNPPAYQSPEDDRRSWESSSMLQPSLADTPEIDYIGRGLSAIRNYKHAEADGPSPPFDCRSKHTILGSRTHWLSLAILFLAFYSTIFSGIYLGIALRKPRYGKLIHAKGNLSPENASLLSALIAKTIELAFVTVTVAFLGQVLSRRAFVTNSRGITIAEMNMQKWIMQPGTLLTHGRSAQYAGTSILGVIALTTAFMAMFYTTASDALGEPPIQILAGHSLFHAPSLFSGLVGDWVPKVLYGEVSTSYANPTWIMMKCRTPTKDSDKEYGGNTCMEIEHAGEAYHNYILFLSAWANRKSDSADLKYRQNAIGSLYDNTTVEGSWIEVQNMTENSATHKRMINNVTMAMPHAGVLAAAQHPRNHILQPDDLEGLGEFSVTASVASPAVNVLCASMTEKELRPFIVKKTPVPGISEDDWLSETSVDDVFGFGEKYQRRHPFFPALPADYQTILNVTMPFGDSIYLLAKSVQTDPPYVLCSMSSFLTPRCSTKFQSSMSGGALSSHCEDDTDEQAYHRSHPNLPPPERSKDWKNVAAGWGLALALNDGTTNNNASNARLLTQLIPSKYELDPAAPSIAEALATMVGCTLLLGTNEAPFGHLWNYSVPALDSPTEQSFNALVQNKEYASGGAQDWQDLFYVVLVLVFATSLFCLMYLLIKGGHVTDYTEPQNLFALALNSPPDERLAGSCGRGPQGKQWKVGWFIQTNNEHVYIGDGLERSGGGSRNFDLEAEASPISTSTKKLSHQRRSWL